MSEAYMIQDSRAFSMCYACGKMVATEEDFDAMCAAGEIYPVMESDGWDATTAYVHRCGEEDLNEGLRY